MKKMNIIITTLLLSTQILTTTNIIVSAEEGRVASTESQQINEVSAESNLNTEDSHPEIESDVESNLEYQKKTIVEDTVVENPKEDYHNIIPMASKAFSVNGFGVDSPHYYDGVTPAFIFRDSSVPSSITVISDRQEFSYGGYYKITTNGISGSEINATSPNIDTPMIINQSEYSEEGYAYELEVNGAKNTGVKDRLDTGLILILNQHTTSLIKIGSELKNPDKFEVGMMDRNFGGKVSWQLVDSEGNVVGNLTGEIDQGDMKYNAITNVQEAEPSYTDITNKIEAANLPSGNYTLQVTAYEYPNPTYNATVMDYELYDTKELLAPVSHATEQSFTIEKKGDLVVNYVDEDGNPLIPQAISTELTGTPYETEPKEFEGYELVAVPNNKDGVYVEGTTEVTYVYKKIQGDLVVNYVDEDGNKLSDSTTAEGPVGSKYTTKPKEIEGYELVAIPNNKDGDYVEGTTEVTYVYKKIKSIPGKDPGKDPGKKPGKNPGKDPGKDPGKGKGSGKSPNSPSNNIGNNSTGKSPVTNQTSQSSSTTSLPKTGENQSKPTIGLGMIGLSLGLFFFKRPK